MPEIDVFLFDLSQLFKLFPKQDKELDNKICEYEQRLQNDMAQNRINLFSEFGYTSQYDNALYW